MAKKTIKTTYMVQCPYDTSHEFEIVVETEQGTETIASTREEYCPFCDKPVQVEIKGKQKEDGEVLRKLGFE